MKRLPTKAEPVTANTAKALEKAKLPREKKQDDEGQVYMDDLPDFNARASFEQRKIG